MKKKVILIAMAAALMFSIGAVAEVRVDSFDDGYNYAKFKKFDRYLDVEIWTDDDEYYQAENISISFRASDNCYVAIYNIDTRGNVNLIYPVAYGDDGWIQGGRIYTIPENRDDYELTVHGPAGVEYLHIIASRRPFPVPDWFNGSGIVCSYDPYDFVDYLDVNYFGCENNCAQAFDLTSFVVNEWNDYYFRPVYNYHHVYNDYWDWWYYGSVYIDYPFGACIYIDGIYWGIAPLFIPRVYYGWHYITVYDRGGYCWEDRIHVYKRKSLLLDQEVIKPKTGVSSRFKEVRKQGYLDPVTNGYPDYNKEVKIKQTYKPVTKSFIEAKNSGELKYNSSRFESKGSLERSRMERSTGREVESGKIERQSSRRTSEGKAADETYKSGGTEKRGTDRKTLQTAPTERKQSDRGSSSYRRQSGKAEKGQASAGRSSSKSTSTSKSTAKTESSGSSGKSNEKRR
jgi:hypothetical protein